MKKKAETEITSSLSPAGDSPYIQNHGGGFLYVPTQENTGDLVKKWFINPLREMDRDRDKGFIIITALFPLYEKYLRFNHADLFEGKGRDRFQDGHPIFKKIGKDLNLSNQASFNFWQLFRNGLLHRAMPKKSMKDIKWQMGEFSDPVLFQSCVFYVDPIKLRDHILNIIEPNLRMWKDDGIGFPMIYYNLR